MPRFKSVMNVFLALLYGTLKLWAQESDKAPRGWRQLDDAVVVLAVSPECRKLALALQKHMQALRENKGFTSSTPKICGRTYFDMNQ